MTEGTHPNNSVLHWRNCFPAYDRAESICVKTFTGGITLSQRSFPG